MSALDDRYTIVREVGAGGTAVVFLARDRKHGRDVAIKFLRPELAASVGAERFLREIEVAARLQHPHIVPVYDSGAEEVAGGRLYYVMPFVEGESLRRRLEREGPLPVAEAVRLAGEVAGALAFAHTHGVVHRDIKPDNILLAGGHAVVADFGIARAIAGEVRAQLTATGMAVGTPMYMSPEQALGGEEVDARSDIYSLGCVVYQMLTGEPPFKGPSLPSIIAQTITGARPRVRAIRRDVPAALDDAVTKALAREPTDRYANADAFGAALSAALAPGDRPLVQGRVALAVAAAALVGVTLWALWPRHSAGAVVPEAEVIAVLPFNTAGSLAITPEGMVDLLSTNLDGQGGIRVIDPRTVLRRWQAGGGSSALAQVEALEVARDVGAAAALTGSVIDVGPRVRITAALHGAASAPLARAQAEGAADSLLGLIDVLSLEVLREIWRVRDPLPTLRVSALTTNSPVALRAYLEGEGHFRRSDWRAAAAAFNRAIAADSSFALAYLRLAWSNAWLEGGAAQSPLRILEGGARYAHRLPARDRTVFETMRALFADGRYASVDTMEAFVSRYPDDVDGWSLLGEIRFHGRALLGAVPEAVLEPWNRALDLDPTLAPALLHPLELALARGDRAAYATYFDQLRAVGDSQETRIYELAATVAWGPGDAAPAFRELIGRRPTILESIAGSSYRTAERHPGALLDWLASGGAPGAGRSAWLEVATLRARMLAGLGRLRAASALADSLAASGDVSLNTVYAIAAVPLVWAVVRRDTDPPAPAHQMRGPLAPYVQAVLAIQEGDLARARAVLEGALARDSGGAPARLRGLYHGALGWADLAAGDTTKGLERMGAGIRQVGFAVGPVALLTAPLRFQLAVALASRPATRAEGIRRLRYGFDADYEYLPLALLALGDALEASGDQLGARAASAAFVRLWQQADAGLQPVVTRAAVSP